MKRSINSIRLQTSFIHSRRTKTPLLVRSYSTPPDYDPRPTIESQIIQSGATTLISLVLIGVVAYGYNYYYKKIVERKIAKAFKPGDPALEIWKLAQSNHHDPPIIRPEQTLLDDIFLGKSTGHYYLLTGEKGNGKSTLLLSAMNKINGENVSVMHAHRDPEIFRSRLGKCLDFEFSEDFVGGLFSIRGPRESSALLDIERAFNKLEKVAIKNKAAGRKPFILVINSLHLVQDTDDGNAILESLQQRAETWASAGLITMVFNSDDYWVYERLKQNSRRKVLVKKFHLMMS